MVKRLSVSQYVPVFEKLPREFDGFVVAHIADLHNADFGGRLEDEIAKQKPGIIVMTGDIVSFEDRYANALALVKSLAGVAPVFYVNGNHEGRFKDYDKWRVLLQDNGVICLENKTYVLTRGGKKIAVIGINDPSFFKSAHRHCERQRSNPGMKVCIKLCNTPSLDCFVANAPRNDGNKKQQFKQALSRLSCALPDNTFKILLSHRPEFFPFYAGLGIDLTFSGHAHGGQIRLPLPGRFGSLYAPGQGVFPKYVTGLCRIGDSYMSASRGLGHITFRMPPRIFNKPELVFVKLQKRRQSF